MTVVTMEEDANVREARLRTAMQSKDHLKQWMQETGKRYVVLKSDDLMDALPWPEGHEALTHLVMAYRAHRQCQIASETPCMDCNGKGEFQGRTCTDCNGSGVERHYKTDVLELDEMKDAVKWLMVDIHKKDPEWRP